MVGLRMIVLSFKTIALDDRSGIELFDWVPSGVDIVGDGGPMTIGTITSSESSGGDTTGDAGVS